MNLVTDFLVQLSLDNRENCYSTPTGKDPLTHQKPPNNGVPPFLQIYLWR